MASGETKLSLMDHITSAPDDAKIYVVLPDNSYGYITKAEFLDGIAGGGIVSVNGDLVDNTDPDNPVILTPNLQQALMQSGTATDLGIFLDSASSDLTTDISSEYINLVDGATGNQVFIDNLSLGVNDSNEGIVILKDKISRPKGSFNTDLVFTDPTANREIMFQDADGTVSHLSDLAAGLATKEDVSNKGIANGYAPLNASNLIPSTHLPSYVDDVVEGYKSGASFYEDSGHTILITGVQGKIYVDLTAGQSNKQYRWSGSAFIQITNGLIASTDDVSEGGSNLYFTVARVLATVLSGLSASSGTFTTSNTVLEAFGKCKYLIDNLSTLILGQVLTGFSAASGTVSSSDTVLSAINKIVGNINLKQDKPDYIKLTSAYTLANTTSLQKAFNVGSGGNGAYNAAANRTIRFKTQIYLSGLSASSGNVSFGILGTAGVASIIYTAINRKTNSLSTGGTANATVIDVSTISAITASNASGNAHLEIEGTLVTSTAGTIILSIATGVGTGAATVAVNSFAMFDDIGLDTLTATSNIT